MTQFLCELYVSVINLHDHSFGGVINTWFVQEFTLVNNLLRFVPAKNFSYDANYSYYINDILVTSQIIYVNSIDKYWRKSITILPQYHKLATLSSKIPLEKGNCRCNTCNNEDKHDELESSYIQNGDHNIINVIITVIASLIKCINDDIIDIIDLS